MALHARVWKVLSEVQEQEMVSQSNALGDIRAEHDHLMLQQAFIETADYRTLIESTDKVIAVGRRGTGKSALTFRLS